MVITTFLSYIVFIFGICDTNCSRDCQLWIDSQEDEEDSLLIKNIRRPAEFKVSIYVIVIQTSGVLKVT